MKCPKIPTKPWAPYKPNPPDKQIERRVALGDLTSQEDGTFSIQWFIDYISQNFPEEDSSTVKFSMEVDKTYGYYDEISTSLNFHFYKVEMVDNPNFDRLQRHYEKQLNKYNEDYQKYKNNLEQYKIDEKKYKEDLEQWRLEEAKAIVARHEKKKGKNK